LSFYCRNAEHPKLSLFEEASAILAINLPADAENRLQALAEKTGRTKAEFARDVILRAIEDMEDLKLAIERLENPGRRWTLEEAKRELGQAN
jgi:RHH-type rel operon transcriptional repressor/antitoxin RelB